MKMGIQMINSDATVNNFRIIKNQKINQGETVNLMFQLIDLDKKGHRFLPSATAIAFGEIARYPDILGSYGNQRIKVDYSIRRNCAMAFPADDRSMWYLPLSPLDTKNMMSSNLRVTVVDGNNTYIAVLSMAMVVTRSELDPEPQRPEDDIDDFT